MYNLSTQRASKVKDKETTDTVLGKFVLLPYVMDSTWKHTCIIYAPICGLSVVMLHEW